MKQFCLGVIVAIGLTPPANAFDGTRTPSPPNVPAQAFNGTPSPAYVMPPLKAEPLPSGLLAQAPNPAKAQSLRDQLIGAWSLVSCDPKFPAFYAACGKDPNGIVMYDASGRYAVIFALRGRPKVSAGRNSPAEELKAMVAGVVANFGTWSVNETDKTIAVHVDGALYPNTEGMEPSPDTISISGDELTIGNVRVPDAYNVYRRIKR
jgi:Lipocalin-like domain